MESEHILSQPARVLRQEQREHYFEHGYLFIEGIVGNDWLERLRAATYRHLEASREVTISNEWYDLAPVHTKAVPCIRRLLDPEREECFWAFANDVIADVAADLLGSDVLFHHGKLNFKWPGAGETNAIAWHQDLAFYPLTNYKSAAIGCYLEDTTLDHGPLQVVKGSHEAEIFTHYDDNDEWTGQLNAEDESAIDSSKVVSMPGPAGSITVHNVRTLHGSLPSQATNMRPLLVNAYTAADAFPYTPGGRGPLFGEVVRGKPAAWSVHDPRPCRIPPDWSAGYPSLFDQQQGEEAGAS